MPVCCPVYLLLTLLHQIYFWTVSRKAHIRCWGNPNLDLRHLRNRSCECRYSLVHNLLRDNRECLPSNSCTPCNNYLPRSDDLLQAYDAALAGDGCFGTTAAAAALVAARLVTIMRSRKCNVPTGRPPQKSQCFFFFSELPGSQTCSCLPEHRDALLQKWIGSWNGFLESLNGLNGHAALLSCCYELNVGFLFYQRHFDMSTWFGLR
jgi:hypothetical protein